MTRGWARFEQILAVTLALGGWACSGNPGEGSEPGESQLVQDVGAEIARGLESTAQPAPTVDSLASPSLTGGSLESGEDRSAQASQGIEAGRTTALVRAANRVAPADRKSVV